ncbi:hypothetical protein [Chenggangzhangella methanolivorans]|uniref:Uncharacterized protein n=1 Tax=Chenggangzhangella methanolivorans TaxID=1437009 RepID=A0A9E6UP44_9HYPH|nr:hypothetical protein [Chenggangzhangella methanolivorans]QZN99329.1 hypothetical protein K6K41_21490 [Chenggangzhangella methanolivorans]
MTRSLSLAAALALALAAPAAAQSPEGGPRLSAPGGQQQPSEPAAAEMPGPTTEIIGPDGSFRLQPDGTTWERFQSAPSACAAPTRPAAPSACSA